MSLAVLGWVRIQVDTANIVTIILTWQQENLLFNGRILCNFI